MKAALAALLVAHGLAHLVGFLGPWRLMDPEQVTFQKSLLGGRLDVGTRTMRALGVVWLVLALAFLGVGAGVLLGWAGWPGAALGVAAASLAMCALAWPAARIGVFVNLAVLALVATALASGWT